VRLLREILASDCTPYPKPYKHQKMQILLPMKKLTFRLLVGLLFVSTILNAQAPTERLFKPIPAPLQELTSEQMLKFEAFKNSPSVSAVTFVAYTDIFEVEKEGKLLLQLPGTAPFVVEPRMVTTDANEGYIYNGTIENGTEGYVALLKKGQNYFGQINYRSKSYRIETIDRTFSVVLTQDLNYGGQECTSKSDKGKLESKPTPIHEKSCGTSIVDILVTYTDAANNAVTDIEAEANLLIAQLNTITENSGIPQDQVTFNLVDVINANFDMTNFGENGMESALIFYTFSDFNQQRAETYGADIVIMLTNKFSSYGIAFPDKTGDEFYSFAIAEVDAPAQRYTFAHEIAHVFGCRHDNDNSVGFMNPNIADYANGYIFPQGGQVRRTLLSTAGAADPRIMHLSNPDVDFNSIPTGVNNERNNAQQMMDMACTIAGYRDLPPDPSIDDVIISGYDAVAAGGTEVWCAQVYGCSGSTSFQWEYSTSGPFNGWITSTTGSCGLFTMPQNSDLWLRVTATCDFGSTTDTDSDVHYVRRKTAGAPPDAEPLGSPVEEAQTAKYYNSDNRIEVYPNPAKDFLKIVLPSASHDDTQNVAEIINLSGKLVRRFNFTGQSGTIDLQGLKDGVYLLRSLSPEGTTSKKIVIRK